MPDLVTLLFHSLSKIEDLVVPAFKKLFVV
jgi:hypothetical protein